MDENRPLGRPPCPITRDQVAFLRRTGLNWTKIAAVLNINRRTLFRYRRNVFRQDNVERKISNEELDVIIMEIITETPNVGEVYVIGALRSRNLKIPRSRVRERSSRIQWIQ